MQAEAGADANNIADEPSKVNPQKGNLTLRLTWPDRKNDYVILEDGVPIGRTYLANSMNWNGHAETWLWFLQFHNPIAAKSGSAYSLEDAKVGFKAAWDAVRPKLTPEDFEYHRRAHAAQRSK